MAVDPRYITTNTLEPYFVDKTTGAPLAGGIVSFFIDTNRAVPKLVYELTAMPPYPPAPPSPALNPSFTALPNPIILSAVGTIQDAAGNNVALYYFPFDAFGNPELYYITVTDRFGVEQFTREGWPFIGGAGGVSPIGQNQPGISNELSNPQFARVLFIPTQPLVIAFAGAGVTTVNIAPDWSIQVTSGGAGNVTVTRNSITGITAYPHNPPYTLTVTPGANVVGLKLIQRLNQNPDVWSPQVLASTNGYISGSILLAPASQAIITYEPSIGPPQIILNANNLTPAYAEFNSTVKLAPATNTDNSDVGFVNIVITLPPGVATTFSNIQVVGLESNIQNVIYDQTPVNRQIDHLYNYYDPLLQFKPIQSYLVAWDFPFNPRQALGPNVGMSAAGANTSRYVMDQTIMFQSANNGPNIAATASNALAITANVATQFAIIQYLPQDVARRLLTDRLSVTLSAFANTATPGILGTISLWYTNDVNLPSCAANNSIVATLDANGKPATFNGIWFEVPRSGLGDAVFSIPNQVNSKFTDLGFSGWDLQGAPGTVSATYFAIVVGFNQMLLGDAINVQSISLVPGDIPTRPGPRTASNYLLDCQAYYQKSFNPFTIPAQAVGINTGEYVGIPAKGGAANGAVSPIIHFPVLMNTVPTITLYSPALASNQIYDYGTGTSWTNTVVANLTQKGFYTGGTTDPATLVGSAAGIHWVADARLGR